MGRELTGRATQFKCFSGASWFRHDHAIVRHQNRTEHVRTQLLKVRARLDRLLQDDRDPLAFTKQAA